LGTQEGSSGKPRIEIAPESAFADEPVQIKLAGFEPGRRVTLRASLDDDAGNRWQSHAVFNCDADGGVDLSRQKPVSGTYREPDPMGLFWSMLPEGGKDSGIYVKMNAEPKKVIFQAEIDGTTAASAETERIYLAPGCERIPVDEGGIIGTYFKPVETGPRPGVIILHGTSNRIMEERGALLASRGYATLSLLYFGGKGLSEEFIRIPLEYFDKCIAWLTARTEVGEGGVTLMGVSRGGEGALLAASKLPRVSAVVSISGGGVVFEGLRKNPREGEPDAPWSWQGDPVPFAERKDSFLFTMKAIRSGMSKKPLSTLSTYIDGMKDREAIEGATIEVENIKGPVLFVSGTQDKVWPSSELSRIALERLRKNDHPYPDEHLDYEGAGHVVFMAYQPATVGYTRVFSGMALDFGGSPAANARASADSWVKMLRFLEKASGKQV
jgi:dienelactone hydrolase